MTGPEVTRATPARHRGAAPVDTELEELVGSDVIDVEVEPIGRPLLRFTVAATAYVLGFTFMAAILTWVLLPPLSALFVFSLFFPWGDGYCNPAC